MGSHQGSYIKPSNQRCTYHLKPGYMTRAVFQLVHRFNVLNIIGQSKMNESLPDMTPCEMLLDVSVPHVRCY